MPFSYMRVRDIKRWLAPLRNTPLHPQWLLRQRGADTALDRLDGVTVDIGCADQAIRHRLPKSVQYIGLDYYQTAVEWYGTRPDIFADARRLPIADELIDSVLMLHVLEHLDRPGQALSEVERILRPGGTALIEVPFMYPVHDAPLDYRRWTDQGLIAELAPHGFVIEETTPLGRASETAAVLFNLALARLSMDWIDRRSPWLLLAPALWLLFPVFNLIGWSLAPLQTNSDFMPHRIRVLCRKPGRA